MLHIRTFLKKMFFTLITVFVCQCISSQQINLTGTVISKTDGQPLIGAAVLEAGTTNGVVTDIDGHFTINNVKTGTKLVISYIGFIPANVAAAQNMKVELVEDVQKLGEVVVVG